MLLTSDPAFSTVPVRGIEVSTLNQMLEAYDLLFFNSYLQKRLGIIELTLSSKLTSSAGKFICTRGAFGRIVRTEIRMSSDFLLRLQQGPFQVNGLQAATPQEAFLLVFEHELCHAAETALYGKTGHSARFLQLANGLFGHTATRHALPTRRQEAAQSGLHIGMKVSFIHQGAKLTGIISYIGKTATVMVPSVKGTYHDKSMIRYEKYRVPLQSLSASSVCHEQGTSRE